jgi:putative Mn2+ efflux pump MntP
MIEAVILAVALAMDATAVAAARGLAARPGAREAVLIGLVFGAFQAGMAAIGWAVGAGAAGWIEPWDHWVAFGVLVAIGGKMLVEAWRREGLSEVPPLSGRLLVVLAVATSLDALAAGVTLPVLEAREELAIALIGGVTAVLAVLGGLAGRALGARAGSRLELLGGLALCAIGVKILIEHLW